MSDLWRQNDDRERVRDASDIVRVIGEQVSLKPKGREYVGLCPFHEDRNPSMTVSAAKQIYKCFVCGAGGDVFSFVMNFHKMEFREAIEFLAERAGVTLTPAQRVGGASAGEVEAGLTRADLRRINAVACEYFRAILRHPEHGRAARAVVERRGIAPDMVEQFQLGAAADRWDGLAQTAAGKGVSLGSLSELGLVRRRDSGDGHFDFFRNRLVFPIHDQAGAVIAFGGRKIRDEDEPKYLNSPETRLFSKSRTLYGLHQAAREIQRQRTVLITEGYTDTIACHQGGFGNAVATLGTALTREHASVLRRLCETVVLLFDGDEAGQRAADRAVEVFFSEDLDVKICTLARYTDAKDPDELLKRDDGAEVFARALGGSVDLLDYRFERMRTRLAGKGLSALSRGIEEELARLVELGLNEVHPVRRRLIVKRLAGIAGVDEQTIVRSIPAGRAGRSASRAESVAEQQGGGRLVVREREMSVYEHLLACVLTDGALWTRLDPDRRARLVSAGYRSALISEVAASVGRVAGDGQVPELDVVLADLERRERFDGSIDAAVQLQQAVDRACEGLPARVETHWNECWRLADTEAVPASGSTDAIGVIEQKRQEHARLGGDRRILPRPG